MRTFQSFVHRDANFRISSSCIDIVKDEIKKQRYILDSFISENETFLTSLNPVSLSKSAPPIAKIMNDASCKTGVGPMAAVAGTFAQLSAEAAIKSGATEAIIENGGDMYLMSDKPISVGLFSGHYSALNSVALQILPNYMPVALCSSSSHMGHSLSMGSCDLATVISEDAALADCAATHACNLVASEEDVVSVLEKIMAIDRIRGVIIVKNDKVGIFGELPPLIKQSDKDFICKITKDKNSMDWLE